MGASLALIATGSLWATGIGSTSPHIDIVESITQQKMIKGKVLDVQGESIIGANVIIKVQVMESLQILMEISRLTMYRSAVLFRFLILDI
ncbi:MAG: hypothetical protein ACLUE2_01335 [Bacteroides cellulosilyticus]